MCVMTVQQCYKYQKFCCFIILNWIIIIIKMDIQDHTWKGNEVNLFNYNLIREMNCSPI